MEFMSRVRSCALFVLFALFVSSAPARAQLSIDFSGPDERMTATVLEFTRDVFGNDAAIKHSGFHRFSGVNAAGGACEAYLRVDLTDDEIELGVNADYDTTRSCAEVRIERTSLRNGRYEGLVPDLRVRSPRRTPYLRRPIPLDLFDLDSVRVGSNECGNLQYVGRMLRVLAKPFCWKR